MVRRIVKVQPEIPTFVQELAKCLFAWLLFCAWAPAALLWPKAMVTAHYLDLQTEVERPRVLL